MINYIRVKIEGLNVQKIIDKLIDDEVLIENFKNRSKSIVFDINEKDEYLVKRACNLYRKNYQIISRHNFLNLLKRSVNYLGFILAIVFSVCFIFANNLYISKINFTVNGAIDYDLAEIQNILKTNGVCVGLQKKSVNIKEIEKLIISSKDVAGCSVKQAGGVLNIILYPAVINNEVKTENIYSKYNAVITDVEIYSGIAKVKKGDLIKKGDLLIENNNGASGKIMAKIYYTDYILYNENHVVAQKTGRVCEEKLISLFNKVIDKTAKNKIFSNFIVEDCVFCVSKNLFLPISVVNRKYIEIEYQDVVVKFEEKENELKNQLYESVKKNVSNPEQISNVTYSIVCENNLTRLDCFIECEINLLA